MTINFHSAVLLNSPSIFDKIFSDEFILDIIGALECTVIFIVTPCFSYTFITAHNYVQFDYNDNESKAATFVF